MRHVFQFKSSSTQASKSPNNFYSAYIGCFFLSFVVFVKSQFEYNVSDQAIANRTDDMLEDIQEKLENTMHEFSTFEVYFLQSKIRGSGFF